MGKAVFKKEDLGEAVPLPESPEVQAVREKGSSAPLYIRDIPALSRAAQELYDSAQEALRKGDWALYGEEIKKLGEVISELEERSNR